MSGGVWLGAHKMCAPEETGFDPLGRGLEACFGPKPIFIIFLFSWDSGGLCYLIVLPYGYGFLLSDLGVALRGFAPL